MKMTEISSEAENMWLQVKSEVTGTCTEDGCVNLVKAASVVKKNSGTLIPLVKPKSYHVRVCRQDDTVYAGNEDQLDAWEDHYLPERMAMEVIGAIDDFPCEAYDRQLVLLLCEDGNIYAYEDEVLHLVARSLRDLFESGMTFPGIKSFNLGECFEDYTEEEYNEMMECSEIKEMTEKYNKFQESLELELLALLQQFKCSQFKEELQMWSDIEVVENVKTSETTCLDIVVRKSMVVVPCSRFDADLLKFAEVIFKVMASLQSEKYLTYQSEYIGIANGNGKASLAPRLLLQNHDVAMCTECGLSLSC